MKDKTLKLAREAEVVEYFDGLWFACGGLSAVKTFEALVRADERARLEHNNEVLMNALWKACGDDEEIVNATIESQGELK